MPIGFGVNAAWSEAEVTAVEDFTATTGATGFGATTTTTFGKASTSGVGSTTLYVQPAGGNCHGGGCADTVITHGGGGATTFLTGAGAGFGATTVFTVVVLAAVAVPHTTTEPPLIAPPTFMLPALAVVEQACAEVIGQIMKNESSETMAMIFFMASN